MFEVPDAKRIKRSEFFQDGSDSDQGPGPESAQESERESEPEVASDEAKQKIPNYGFQYDFVANIPTPAASSGAATGDPARISKSNHENDEHEDPTYTFRLFATPSKEGNHGIRLSETPEPTTLASSLSLDRAHFTRPQRPDSYYFTAALPASVQSRMKAEYAAAAKTSSDITKAASSPYPGASLPWRLISLPTSKRQVVVVRSSPTSKPARDEQNPRTRRNKPSKSRRLVLHRRAAEKRQAEARANMDAAEREAEEREKRTRRNREKKVKRKEREKKRKNAVPGTAVGGDDADQAP